MCHGDPQVTATWSPAKVVCSVIAFDDRLPRREVPRDVWKMKTARYLVPLEIDTTGSASVTGRLAGTSLSYSKICILEATPHMGVRTAELAPGVGSDFVKLALPTAGAVTVRQHGRETTLLPGQSAVYECRYPYEIGGREPFGLCVVLLPREALAVSDTKLAAIDGSNLRGSDAEAVLVLVQDVLRRRDGALTNLTTVLSAAVRATPDVVRHRPVSHRQLFDEVLTFIDATLDDESLNVARIAAAHGVSVRTLQVVFKENGSSVQRYLQSRRLERARYLLQHDEHGLRPVAEIASVCGFADAAYFARAFRAAYGFPPTAARTLSVLRE